MCYIIVSLIISGKLMIILEPSLECKSILSLNHVLFYLLKKIKNWLSILTLKNYFFYSFIMYYTIRKT